MNALPLLTGAVLGAVGLYLFGPAGFIVGFVVGVLLGVVTRGRV